MDRKLNRFVKIYPWFHGLTADLLFYIAIDTLFLTAVKNLSAAQIVSLTTIFLPLGGLSFALLFFWGEPQLNYIFPIISSSGVSDHTDFPYSDLLFYLNSCCSM